MDYLLKKYFIVFVLLSTLNACGGGSDKGVPAAKVKSGFNKFVLVFDGNATGTGTVKIVPSNKVCDNNCLETFTTGTKVTLTENATIGSSFKGFRGGPGCSTGEVVVNDDITCAVKFDLIPGFTVYDLTVTPAGTGFGVVTSNPAGINCGTKCVKGYAADSLIKLIETAAQGSNFVGWTGTDCPVTGLVTMTSAINCTATFALNTTDATLTVTLAGTGSGSVASTPKGINCSTATCTAQYALDTIVTLTAIPASNNTFTGWGGSCTDSTAVTTVTMSAAKTCIANFNISPGITLHNLSMTMLGGGQGRITSTPSDINCTTGTCTKDFAVNTVVTLTAAAANATSKFASWGGACNDTNPTTVITMSAAQACTATFDIVAATTYPLQIIKAGNGTGIVTSTPPGINCGGTCNKTHNANTVVTLSATAAQGSTFAGWTGTGCGPTITMIAARNCTAKFDLIPSSQFSLTVIKAGKGTGTVTSSPAGIICGATCIWYYNPGTGVSLTPTANAGSTFVRWTGDCGQLGNINIGPNRTCTATFDLISSSQFSLTVIKAGKGTGTVTSTPAGINCGTTCIWYYNPGTGVSLKATANTGSVFGGWTGDCGQLGNINIGPNRTCTATFN
ncbi:MAG: hypothetical protein ACC657_13695 [Thiohalomonadales bacterium]